MIKNTNNIFLRTYKPTTSTLRFKKKVHNIFFKIKKKFKCSFLKKSTQIRPFGRKLIRTKGRIIRNRVFNTDFKKNWNNGFYVIISHITVRRKLHSLIKYTNGAMTYTTTTSGCFIGDVNYTTNLPPYLWCFNKPGTTVLLFFLKKFSVFNNLVLKNKSKYAKANGTFCQIVEILEDLCLVKIKLPSGQKKIINSLKFVTLGRCDNILWNREVLGKAGTMLNRGIKSKVRGVAMNPVDHPHGGRTKTNKPEVSPWGWVTKKNK